MLEDNRARKKCRPGQVDSPSGQVTLHSHLPNGEGSASHLPTKSLKEQTKTCPGQQNFRATVLVPRASLNSSFFRTLDKLYVPDLVNKLKCCRKCRLIFAQNQEFEFAIRQQNLQYPDALDTFFLQKQNNTFLCTWS